MQFPSGKYWVNWKLVTRDGTKTKIPYTPSGTPASSTDPKTWSTYADVLKASKHPLKKFSGIGIVIAPELNFVAIDLDKCLKDGEFDRPEFRTLVEKANTYTEISPSGTGVHLFLRTPEPFIPKASRSADCPGFEMYTHGRYFTYTGDIFEGRTEIRTISNEDVENLLSLVGYPWGAPDLPQPSKIDQGALETHHTLDESHLLERMFSSKNGAAIRALYDGDTSAYNKDDSSADAALLAHLAFWTKKNASLMESIWLASPLGRRKKTQGRKDYRDRSINKAIKNCRETYEPPPQVRETSESDYNEEFPEQERITFTVDSKGKPYISAENVTHIIRGDALLKKSFRYNAFFDQEETNFQSDDWHAIQKDDIVQVMIYIQHKYTYFEKVPKQTVEDAVISCVRDNVINPPADYLKALVWDRTNRLDTWLTSVYGAPEDEVHCAMGANWLKGLVKRVVVPGCKFDYVLVLEGPQGWKKSTSLSILGKPWHVETIMAPDTKDFFMLLRRNIIVEFSEGETLSRSEVKRLKGVLTMLDDEYRNPYDREIRRYPRRCVFAMTTNQSEYLKDESGNRRWLPVAVTKIADIKWLEENRDQLFAEAYYRAIKLGETTWEFPEKEIVELQASRMVEDSLVDKMVAWYTGKMEIDRQDGVTADEAYNAVFLSNLPFGKAATPYEIKRITDMFKLALGLEKKRRMVGGIQKVRWMPTEKTKELFAMPTLLPVEGVENF